MSSVEQSPGTGSVTIVDAYVAAESGIAVSDSTTTVPDQIYVEFGRPVGVADGEGAVPADGFRLDGTIAGIETVQEGRTERQDESEEGSRVLVLSLSAGITANESPRLSYDPSVGSVETCGGDAVEAVDGMAVELGSPRVLDVAVSVDRGDALRVTFDRPVVSRTGDTVNFEVTGGNGGRLLSGDMSVEGERVWLGLTRDVTGNGVDMDGDVTLRYRAGGSDTERVRNLASRNGALVQPFDRPVTIEKLREGFSIVEARVPLEPNDSGNTDHSRLALQFDPPVTAESAAGYELQNSRARIVGLASAGGDGDDPDVMLDLDAPLNPDDGSVTVRYTPDHGDTRAVGNEVPAGPLSAEVNAVGGTPTPVNAHLTDSGQAVVVEFSREVRSQTGDATGFTLAGAGDVALTGSVEQGATLRLELTEQLEFRETSNTVKLHYSTQGNSGRRLNFVGAAAGVPVESFSLELSREGDTPRVKHASIPDDARDTVLVRFDRPVEADTVDGFSLDGAVARVEELTTADDLDDRLIPYTVVLGLHVAADTGSATVRYDASVGTLDAVNGTAAESFEQRVDVLPPAPSVRGAFVRGGESAVRVRYNREVVLNQGDATGFSLSYSVDNDELAALTGRAMTDGTDVLLETDGSVDTGADPTVVYRRGDGGLNVLGAAEGVAAEDATAIVERREPENGGRQPPQEGDNQPPEEGDDQPPESGHPPEGGEEGDADDGHCSGGGTDDGAGSGDGDTDDGAGSGEDQPPTDGNPCGPEFVRAEIPRERRDRILCYFDGPIVPDESLFDIDGVDVEVNGVFQPDEPTQLVIKLDNDIDEGEDPIVLFNPSL